MCLSAGVLLLLFACVSFYLFNALIARYKIRRHYYFYLELLMSFSILIGVSVAMFVIRSLLEKVPMRWDVLVAFGYYSLAVAPFPVVIMRTVLIVRELLLLAAPKIPLAKNVDAVTADLSPLVKLVNDQLNPLSVSIRAICLCAS